VFSSEGGRSGEQDGQAPGRIVPEHPPPAAERLPDRQQQPLPGLLGSNLQHRHSNAGAIMAMYGLDSRFRQELQRAGVQHGAVLPMAGLHHDTAAHLTCQRVDTASPVEPRLVFRGMRCWDGRDIAVPHVDRYGDLLSLGICTAAAEYIAKLGGLVSPNNQCWQLVATPGRSASALSTSVRIGNLM